MKSKWLFLVSGLLAASGIVSIVVPFNGSISVNAGLPINTTTTFFQINGATKGWPLLLALALLISAIILFVAVVIRWLLVRPDLPPQQTQPTA